MPMSSCCPKCSPRDSNCVRPASPNRPTGWSSRPCAAGQRSTAGETAWYDKRHLFRPGGEARDYTPGDRRVIVEYMGFRFLLLVCYDLRFPVWSRNRGDYDAILCSASWADDRREVWRTLLRARAIENQCYLAGVNRVGTDPDASSAGDSALIDFAGRTLADAGDRERTLIAEFDSEAQAAFKEKFPAWMDADDFELKC